MSQPGDTFQRLHRELQPVRAQIRPRLWFWGGIARALPTFTLGTVRAALYRLAGCRIGPQTALLGPLRLVGDGPATGRLQIGAGCLVAPGVTFGLDGDIIVGGNVSLGPGVTVYTATHGIGFGSRRMNYAVVVKPVTIGDGVWIGMNSLILPGVTVGAGSVVAAGSVVSQDVAPNTLVAGNPAQVLQNLPFGNR